MVFPSNNMPGMPPGMMPGGPMPMPRAPFPQPPMPPGMQPMFAGIPGANSFANRPMAMAVPGLPPGMPNMRGVPMGMPGPIDPFTGRPLNIGLNMGPALQALAPIPLPMPMPMPQQAAGPEASIMNMFNSLLGTIQSTQQPAQPENPLMSVFNTLMGSLSGLLGVPTDEDGSSGAEESMVISDPATALSTILSESGDIAGADGDSGSVSTADLAMVARNKDGKYSADAQAAAQFLMANQAIWSAIDNLDSTADTKASIENLSKALSDPNILNATADNPPSDTVVDEAETIADPATALTSLIAEGEDVADADGDASSVSVQDLVIVSRNKDDDFSAEAQAAAKFMLANQAIWNEMDALDETEDTKVTLENLSKAISDPDILAASADDSSSATGEEFTIANNTDLLDLLDENFEDIAKYDDDASNISLLDLSKATRDSKNKELLAVVEYLRSNPEVFKQLAKKAGEDGNTDSVSEADITKALGDTDFMSTTQEEAAAQDPKNLTMKDILSTLNDNKAKFDGAVASTTADQKIDKAELEEIANNAAGTHDAKLVAAANAALKNEKLMAALDTRGTFSFDDLQTFADAAKTDENYVPPATISFSNSQDAYKVLSKAITNGTLGTGDWDGNGIWTGANAGAGKSVDIKVITAIADGTQPAPYELKEACKWIVKNPAELQKLEMYDNMDGFDDTTLQVDLINAVASGPVEENFGLDVGNQSVVSGEDKRKAKEIFSRNDNALLKKIDAIQGGNPDGVINNDDMWAAVHDRTGKFTVEEKRAILTVIGGDDGNVDGSIWDNINDDDTKATYDEFFRDIEQ